MNDEAESFMGAESEEEAAEFRELAAEFGLSLPLMRPRDSVKQKLMAKVGGMPQNPLQGVFVIRAEGGEWKQTPWAGVDYKPLYYDEETTMQTVILRLAAGARYPSHRHKRAEQCLVLRGDVCVGEGVEMGPGDFEWAEAATEHAYVTTREGCELLIIASRQDEILR